MAAGLHSAGVSFRVVTPRIISGRKEYGFPIFETSIAAGHEARGRYMREVKEILRRMQPQPDILWSPSYWSADFLHDLGIPMIVTHEDSSKLDDELPPVRSYKNVMHRLISQNMHERWCVKAPWLLNESFALWPGFEDSEFALETNKDPKTILFVGQLEDLKGINEFQQLAEWNPDWQFNIYGPKSMKQAPRHPNIKFWGELMRGEAHRRAFQRTSKFFMFTKWHEAFGRTVVEALSKGTPVLGSNRGSLPELISSEVGIASSDLHELNATLRCDFEPSKVFNFAKAHFTVDQEIKEMLRWSHVVIKRQGGQEQAKSSPVVTVLAPNE